MLRDSLLFILAGAVACGGSTGEETNRIETSDRSGYPAGPYGTTEGSVLTNHAFVSGDGSALDLESIHVKGEHRLLLITTSAGWCTACIEEQPLLVQRHEKWAAKGLFVLLATFEKSNFEPSDAAFAARWKDQYSLPFTVVADPTFVFQSYYDREVTPMVMLVDVDTMKILKIMTGFDATVVDAVIEARLK